MEWFTVSKALVMSMKTPKENSLLSVDAKPEPFPYIVTISGGSREGAPVARVSPSPKHCKK